ncbi:MFS transporter [Hydrogenophaga sp.]|uniref:MFS transporter n=1 Tax=Hydrogenophaga sp. TaxID=1904254 RepID=UPI003D0E9B09
MKSIALPLTALLGGVGLLVLGTGLMFSVIGVQAASANFSVLVTGLIMSAYFAGFVYGTYACPGIIRHVGPIRTFAAMASVASTLPILHALWLNPWAWGVLRFVNGLCLVGLYIAVESWLNVLAPSGQRGRVFALYMLVSQAALALGQWLLLVGDPRGFVPFALASILFSFALLPITLTRVDEPPPTHAPRLGLRELFRISPIGVVGAVGSGLVSGALYSLGHVFGQRVGMSEAGSASFMAITILGGALFQWPVGYLSDRYDHRVVLLTVCLLASVVATLAYLFALDDALWLVAIGAAFGGLVFTIYGLSVAHVNDLIERDRVLQVTGGLLLLHGVGATVGPTVAGAAMDALGPGSFLLYFVAMLFALSMLAWYFIRLRPMNRGERGAKEHYVPMASSSQAVLQLDPRAPDTLHESRL